MSARLNIEPRVRNLLQYLNEIEQGIVQIPGFQRDYIWSRDDIKDLFDSIKNRYPIGSVLFWKPETIIGENKEKIGSYYIPQNKETTYILDGFQRLSTLFGCLTNPLKTALKRDEREWLEYFKLYYDLEEETFTYLRPRTSSLPYQIPVYVLMNSSDFRQYARREFEQVSDEDKIEKYYDRADKLSRVFLEYQIASIDINNANIEEAVEIFSRINSKGQEISFDWMANALSIKDGFRFGDEIDNLMEDLKLYNFDKIDRNVIFRCIQSSFGKLYIDNPHIEHLAKRSDFADVTREALPKIKQAVKFLFEELLLVDNRLLPYNIQLIFIMDFFRKIEVPTLSQLDELKRWFWVTTYSNYFTIYSLANQRRAYYHFQRYLNGEEESAIYNDTPSLAFTVAAFPEKISMGSVRAKALTLFMLNYSNAFMPVNAEEVDGYKMAKILPSNNEAANFIPLINGIQSHNIGPDFKNAQKWLRTLISLHSGNDLVHYFIDSKMLFEYQILEEGNFIRRRRDIIQKQERVFVEQFGLDYGPMESDTILLF